jgi:hypothetical protein
MISGCMERSALSYTVAVIHYVVLELEYYYVFFNTKYVIIRWLGARAISDFLLVIG